VQVSKSLGGRIPNAVLDYMSQQATHEWVVAAELAESRKAIEGIDAADKLGLPSLLRFQVGLTPAESAFFISQATKQGR